MEDVGRSIVSPPQGDLPALLLAAAAALMLQLSQPAAWQLRAQQGWRGARVTSSSLRCLSALRAVWDPRKEAGSGRGELQGAVPRGTAGRKSHCPPLLGRHWEGLGGCSQQREENEGPCYFMSAYGHQPVDTAQQQHLLRLGLVRLQKWG